jgi:AI-2 transport protein TqsA
MLVGSSIDDFSAAMPEYQLRISAQKTQFIDWLTSLGITVPSVLNSSNFDPNAAMRLAASIFAGFGKVLTNSFLILLTVIFILLEVDNFSSKVAAMSGKESRLSRDFVDKLNRYMSIKT